MTDPVTRAALMVWWAERAVERAKDAAGIPAAMLRARAWANTIRAVPDVYVSGWVSYDEAETMNESGAVDIGGVGGIAKRSNVWPDYLQWWAPEARKHHNALRICIRRRGLMRGGFWHQDGGEGVPVFTDGAVGTFSCRAWGDLMACVWNQEDAEAMRLPRWTYCDFAWADPAP